MRYVLLLLIINEIENIRLLPGISGKLVMNSL